MEAPAPTPSPIESAAGAVTVTLRTDSAVGDGTDAVPQVENVVGSSHDDIVAGEPGDNALDGGPGTDTITYAGSATAVTLDLVNGTAQGEGDDALAGFENVVGLGP